MYENKIKVFVTSLNRDRKYPHFSRCGYTTHTFFNAFEKYGNVIYSDLESAEIIFLFVTFLGNDYNFDTVTSELISKFNKPIIIFDYTEYGTYQSEIRLKEYNLFGYKLEFKDLSSDNSGVLNNFLINNQKLIKCYFKRELSNFIDLSTVPFKVYPLEFIGDPYTIDENTKIDTKDEYYNRLCIYNFIWGFSNYSRPRLHGKFLLNMEKFECKFALSYKQAMNDLKEQKNKFIFLTNHDWYERVDLNEINANSMAVLDLYGCGQKCFRNIESTKNTLSIKQDPSKVKFTFDWKDGLNCIFLPVHENMDLDLEKSINILLEYRADKHHLLYDIYLNSIEMNKLYSPKNYVPNHIILNIKNSL